MRVAVFTTYFAPAYLAGGPVQTLGALVRGAPAGDHIDVVTSDLDHGVSEPLQVEADKWVPWEGAQVHYTRSGWANLFRTLRKLRSRRPDHLYFNSLFAFRFSVLPRVLARFGFFRGAGAVVAPRGELNAGALALKSRKKRVFLVAHRLLGLHKNVTWHASTDLEAADIRGTFGRDAVVVVRQNDTLLPTHAVERGPRRPGPCRLVFASRLSAKKRVDLLLEALALVPDDFRLRIIGAFDSTSYEEHCRTLVLRAGLDDRVTFVGPTTREGVLQEFTEADCFVFPTAGENFGHVIGEALSTACPVMASDHTPWSPVLSCGGGAVVVGDDAAAYGSSIAAFVQQGPSGWEEASRRAAAAYREWAGASAGPHLFDLLRDGRPS